jgi:aspartyl-tRNA(Asn)/glutamyl-tRNA(Gln) amidotransferase subunit C
VELNSDLIHKLAYLSRFSLSEDDYSRYIQDLNHILTWVEQLQSVPTDLVEPLTQVLDQPLFLREDCVESKNLLTAVLKNAPETQEGFFVVPKVIG